MNGELHHASRLTAAVKYALAGERFSFESTPYEQEPHFLFQGGSVAMSAEAWLEQLRVDGLRDVFLLSPMAIKKRDQLAFVGGTPFGIACFYENSVTFWTANWNFDQQERLWQISYQEAPWANAPKEKPVFSDPTEPFSVVLTEISQLAEKLEEPGFANCFSKAKDILNGVEQPTEQCIRLPAQHVRLFVAASSAWVFGGMCSWNDSPPYEAKERGLWEEYERLSGALYSQIICAVLYAVNQWEG